MSEPPRRSMMPLLLGLGMIFIIMQPKIRNALGAAVGVVLDPLIGFDGRFPVLTLMLAATIMALATTVLRHFTTDWLSMARAQAKMRHFSKEFQQARKDNNTYKVKKLQDLQPKIMADQQAIQMKSMKTMPITMVLVIPLFAWMFIFVDRLDYWWFSAPWNGHVDMFGNNGILFGSSLLPHWILVYTVLTIPVGWLIQKTMKYISWKERWKGVHPEVHDE